MTQPACKQEQRLEHTWNSPDTVLLPAACITVGAAATDWVHKPMTGEVAAPATHTAQQARSFCSRETHYRANPTGRTVPG